MPKGGNMAKEQQRESVDMSNINIKNKPPDIASNKEKPIVGETPAFEPPAEEVELPSHGYLYQNATSDKLVLNGKLLIRPMTMTEEKILSTNRLIKTGQALNMVFRNCIKSDIDPEDLLSSDRIFLMYWLRAISYGPEYTFTLRCPNPTCPVGKFKYTVDISKQPVKEMSADIKEPIELKLKRSGATIFYNLSRGRTETQARQLRNKKLINATDIDNTSTERLGLLIKKIVTPQGEELEVSKWNMFLNSLIGEDSSIIRDDMNEKDAGIEPIKNIRCPHCDEEFDEDIPITTEFFRVK